MVGESEKRRKARLLAERLLHEAVENEPSITKDLMRVAKSNDVLLDGLRNKFKSRNSLTRKLADESIKWRIPIEKLPNEITTLCVIHSLKKKITAKFFSDTLSELIKSGYEIPKKRIWNAWNLQGLVTDTGYRGINITVISSQKQKFEIQFHTEASFRLKTKTHDLYREFRNPKTSATRKIEITKTILELAENIKRSKGI